jgi:hypothetical protein
MNQKTILIAVGILSIAIFLGLFIHGYEMGARGQNQGLTVTGSVKKTVTADLAKWSTSFTLRAGTDNLKFVLDNSASAKTKLINYVKSLGLEEKNITFLPVQINSIYEQIPGYGQSQNIIGYNVVQSLNVQSTEVEKIEKLSSQTKDLLNLGLVPDYQNTEYLYTKINELRPELFAEATADAKVRAEAIAKGTSSKVGQPLFVKTGVVQILPVNSLDVNDYGAYDLSTKQKDVSATVSVTFELK